MGRKENQEMAYRPMHVDGIWRFPLPDPDSRTGFISTPLTTHKVDPFNESKLPIPITNEGELARAQASKVSSD